MDVPREKLVSFLLDTHLVTQEEVDMATAFADEHKIHFEEALLKKEIVTQDELRRAQSTVLGIPFVDLKKEKLDFGVLSMIPEPIARSHNIVAYNKAKEGLEVAMLNADDLQAINFIQKKVGTKILPRLTDSESIKIALQQYQKSLKAEFGDIIQKEANTIKAVLATEDNGKEATGDELKSLAENLPIVRIVDTLIKHAILQDASDIHIEPMENQLLIRYRIDGILHDTMSLPKDAAAGITARIKVLAKLKLDEKRLPQDGRFKIDTGKEKVSFRVSTLPTHYGEKTVMRLLRENASGFTLESLGMHGASLEQLHEATRQKTGMILSTGPTGSGKTTTLYTILDILNTPDVNISTIEDPIEYQMPRVNQTQVKPEIGFTFGTGLRSLVRQDPDIIMVGEIRDQETAALATNAALTGHLVLSTLHTNSAAGALPRLFDIGVQPFLLSSTVKVIIGQRLVRVLTADKEEYRLSDKELKNLAAVADLDRVLATLKEESVVPNDATWKTIPVYKPKPSEESESGYKGRVIIYEVLKVSSAIQKLISENATSEEINEQARKEGMMTMVEDGLFKVIQGTTTIEEILRVVSE